MVFELDVDEARGITRWLRKMQDDIRKDKKLPHSVQQKALNQLEIYKMKIANQLPSLVE